ncbi:hypothetical protein ACOLXF_003106 [Vibrio fluvialis]
MKFNLPKSRENTKTVEEEINNLGFEVNRNIYVFNGEQGTIALRETQYTDVCTSIQRLMDYAGFFSLPSVDLEFEYFICQLDSYIVFAQLSPKLTAALVDRWQELEQQYQPKILQTYADAL